MLSFLLCCSMEVLCTVETILKYNHPRIETMYWTTTIANQCYLGGRMFLHLRVEKRNILRSSNHLLGVLITGRWCQGRHMTGLVLRQETKDGRGKSRSLGYKLWIERWGWMRKASCILRLKVLLYWPPDTRTWFGQRGNLWPVSSLCSHTAELRCLPSVCSLSVAPTAWEHCSTGAMYCNDLDTISQWSRPLGGSQNIWRGFGVGLWEVRRFFV